ncbi:MAG: Lrp/AsnC family transcriptional regulator [Carbonactinosporaceae bacterium]
MLDDVDRRIVAALAVNGRATWGQVAHCVGVSETTAARRAQRLCDAGLMHVVGVPDPLACGFGQPVLVHLRCAPGAVRRVGSRLAERADARFVAILAGPADVVVELIATDRQHLTRILVDELQAIDGVRETSTEIVLRTFKTSFDWSRELLGDRTGELAPVPVKTTKGPVPLDDVDLALIAELAVDGRSSYAELAATLGVSESMAARRVTALVSRGCVGFAPVIDPSLVGYATEAFIRLRVDLPRLEEAAATLCQHPPARYVSATTGASDLVCEVVLPDSDALYLFVTETLAALPGLRRVETAMELQTLKRAFRPRSPAGSAPASADGTDTRASRGSRNSTDSRE